MLSSYLSAGDYAIYAATRQSRNFGVVVGPAFLYPASFQQGSSGADDTMYPVDMTSKAHNIKHEYDNSPRASITNSFRKANEYSNDEIKFSIDRILAEDSYPRRCVKTEDKRSMSSSTGSDVEEVASGMSAEDSIQFSWLQCTRYKPPKLQRMKKKDGCKKRKLGRNPRVPFTQHQVAALEQKFSRTHYLSSMDVAELSSALNLTETRVKIWFQNRRARERRDRDGKPRSETSCKTFSPPSNSQWRVSNSTSPSNYSQFQDAFLMNHAAYNPLHTPNYSSQ